ncbi:hypothetical protein CLCR_09474 [Cladophialophora carrionii]|uniref:Heterokaryon incompatibility domain-containing protein n=1 Tax=Cladophialophora carrionii TaxID=86049 RepID=A0A1C1CXH9_9EURO|nr:hypothetical protein CLCR_09474 [Cladophialophora carrionii]
MSQCPPCNCNCHPQLDCSDSAFSTAGNTMGILTFVYAVLATAWIYISRIRSADAEQRKLMDTAYANYVRWKLMINEYEDVLKAGGDIGGDFKILLQHRFDTGGEAMKRLDLALDYDPTSGVATRTRQKGKFVLAQRELHELLVAASHATDDVSVLLDGITQEQMHRELKLQHALLQQVARRVGVAAEATAGVRRLVNEAPEGAPVAALIRTPPLAEKSTGAELVSHDAEAERQSSLTGVVERHDGREALQNQANVRAVSLVCYRPVEPAQWPTTSANSVQGKSSPFLAISRCRQIDAHRMMPPVLVSGSAATLAVLQCFLIVKLTNRPSTSSAERVALYLTILPLGFILFSTFEVSSVQILCAVACVAGTFLLCLQGCVSWYPLEVSDSSPPTEPTVPYPRQWIKLFRRDAAAATSGLPSAAFPYSPLAEGSIRLLRFLDRHDSHDHLLRFELYHSKLSWRPEYVALSYSWGSSDRQSKVNIVVDGRTFEVSRNLADALYKLRQNNISTVWVDAICINQKDNIEKSREVTRMFAIYRTAQMVIIWLGLHTSSEDDMHELVAAADDIERPASRLSHSNAPDFKLAALEQLLSRPYWARVWVIQEVAAAKQARIFWGSYIFDLRSLETLLRDRLAPPTNDRNSHDLAQRVLSVRAACRAQQKPRLMDILAMTTSSNTSVLRDKVYGLLGLASDWTDFVQEPNYSKTVSEKTLCREMTSNHIAWYSSADIIFLRSTNPHQAELPSWCPDYFHFQPHEFDKNLIPYVGGKNVNLGWERRRAFGQGSPTMNEVVPDTFITSGDRLILKGRQIGRISALGALLDERSAPSSPNEQFSADDITDRDIGKAFRRLLLICHNQTFGIQPSAAFFSLLYALPDHVFQDRGHMRVKHWLDSHRAFFETFGVKLSPDSDDFSFIARRGGRLSPASRVLPEWREFFSLNEDNTVSRRGEHPLYPMLVSISSILEERMRLMYIHDQVLLGWAHRDAKPDDVVWHLEGCTLQAILRKSEELSAKHGESIYKLIGHAYVDPVMASGRWMAKETRSRLVNLC